MEPQPKLFIAQVGEECLWTRGVGMWVEGVCPLLLALHGDLALPPRPGSAEHEQKVPRALLLAPKSLEG